jgi:hypothetical protein
MRRLLVKGVEAILNGTFQVTRVVEICMRHVRGVIYEIKNGETHR